MKNKLNYIIILIAIYLTIPLFSFNLRASTKTEASSIVEAMDELEKEYIKLKEDMKRLVELISEKIPSPEDKKKFNSLQARWKKFADSDAPLGTH